VGRLINKVIEFSQLRRQCKAEKRGPIFYQRWGHTPGFSNAAMAAVASMRVTSFIKAAH